MLLHHRYPRYLEDGAIAFTNRLPCIYSCVASPLGVVQHLCRQLGLPLACVRPVPVHPSGRGMDIEALEKLYDEDINANRTPLLVLGEVGAPPLGWGSPLALLGEICSQRNLHLHVRGHALALPGASSKDESFSIPDSVTLTPGPWFGVPGLPTVTFYKIPEAITANDQSKVVSASERPGGDEPPNVGIVEAISHASACVAFQFAPPGTEKPPPYYDKLNSWLGQVLQREADMISIEVCETEAHGVVLRYCPLEGAGAACGGAGGAGAAEAGAWGALLEAQLHVLAATVALRDPFHARVRARSGWSPIHPAGLGGGGARRTELIEQATRGNIASHGRSILLRRR
ncbi:hypothetical protein HF086_003387 [Spodoptera exigua]|uniref:PDXDC1/PDXD2 second domain-containing protein n=1 Tax=Spodoptera exigua TaxID=7107 RepID=A0A922MZE9_SPOEX|nr:hypothetical protein HF086_003387 [Spodoptera exigua]